MAGESTTPLANAAREVGFRHLKRRKKAEQQTRGHGCDEGDAGNREIQLRVLQLWEFGGRQAQEQGDASISGRDSDGATDEK